MNQKSSFHNLQNTGFCDYSIFLITGVVIQPSAVLILVAFTVKGIYTVLYSIFYCIVYCIFYCIVYCTVLYTVYCILILKKKGK